MQDRFIIQCYITDLCNSSNYFLIANFYCSNIYVASAPVLERTRQKKCGQFAWKQALELFTGARARSVLYSGFSLEGPYLKIGVYKLSKVCAVSL